MTPTNNLQKLKSVHAGHSLDGIWTRFVGLESSTGKQTAHGPHKCQGLYWTPEGINPTTAFILVHYNGDFSEHYLAPLLAVRGYGVLGWNTRFRGAEDLFSLNEALDDIAAGTRWLLKEVGVKNLIFIGNSGGGSLMAAFHAHALKDPSLGPAKLFITLNAHSGRPTVLTDWLDPSVIDETDPTKIDFELDMFNPANGPPYSEGFQKRYRAAQVARNHRITKWAREELERLNDAGISDRIFPLHRTMADLRFLDATLDPSKRQVPGCYLGHPAKANRSVSMLGRANTLRTWLSMWSLQDSKCKFDAYADKITVPALVIQSLADAGVYPFDARHLYESLASKDKEIVWVEGTHFFENNERDREKVVDVIDEWVKKRV
ncbi:hypothetical protein CkaCkLH20_05304 [Colletotrichum karsti]|uniref:Uncharacterized protein n=1 Tax=Colletotrichum karsti TaxID=1095194 RepID=A0A9P6I615_9PEZI|nr:uncharacterized protein CkaCkLH20_05304 [Colletotrichum karsti]KAF9877038.1 hypothetical protein CkaCkLH20_05304 [Colletotrichum karsti]